MKYLLIIASICLCYSAFAQPAAVSMCTFDKKIKPDSSFAHYMASLARNSPFILSKLNIRDNCERAKYWTKVFNKRILKGINLNAASQYAYSSVLVDDSSRQSIGLNEYSFKNDSLAMVVFNGMEKKGGLPIEAPEDYRLIKRGNKLLLITFHAIREHGFEKYLSAIEDNYLSFAR